jgi:hypothetical protein
MTVSALKPPIPFPTSSRKMLPQPLRMLLSESQLPFLQFSAHTKKSPEPRIIAEVQDVLRH